MNENYYNPNFFSFIKILKKCVHTKVKVNIGDKVIDGILEEVGEDFVLLSNPTSSNWTILPIVYLTAVEFQENIENFLLK